MVIALGEACTGSDKGLPQNAVAARKWFRVAAQAGDSYAMTKYGYLLALVIMIKPFS